MKSIYIILGLLFVSFGSGAQGNYEDEGLSYNKDGKLLNGRCVQHLEEEQIDKVFHYKDGLLDGDYLVYAADGSLMERGSYLAGEKHGKWVSWSEKGIKTGEVNYDQGQRDGKWQIWDESGVLRYVMFYNAGEKVGTWQVYNSSGELEKEKEYTRAL